MLETLLSEDEFRSIPESISKKLDVLIHAYIESYKQSQAEEFDKLNAKIDQESEKNERIALAINQKCEELESIEQKLEARDRENLQLKADIIRHRDEAHTFRLQRDEFMDQQSILEGMLDRRTKELENLKIDRDSLLEKLKAAVEAKVQALSLLDEIQSKSIELDFKEKRLDKEKELLNEQIVLLSNDVTKYSKDIMNMRRENNSQIIALKTQLQQRDEEIRVLSENEEKFKKTIQSLNENLGDLNSRLSGQSEIENQLQQKYIQEIESRCKLVEVYKEMSEESNQKAEELTKTIKELQKLLSDASEQYSELERRFTVNETTYKEHLLQKNETIAALKKELFDANHLIDTLKNDHLNQTLENLSPHAAAAYSMMQKGLTLTQIYTEYATVSEQLLIKTHDNEQLRSTFKSFIEELEGKAHILRKRNEDYAEAMATIEKISHNYDQLEVEYNVLKDKCADADRNMAHFIREREKLQKTITDLGRQVCFLLKEVEESRGGEIIMKHSSDDSTLNTSDFSNSSDIISKKLVTFHDIQDLQQTNQKLLSVIRDLSEEFERAENKLKICNKEEMEETIRRLENTLSEKNEAVTRQEKIIQMLKSQLKMLQMVANDSSPGNRRRIISEDMLEVKEVIDSNVQTDSVEIEMSLSADLKKELKLTKSALADLKSEFEAAEKEHTNNEKSLLESIEKSEQSYQKVLQDNKKAIAQIEISQQRCKTLESNIDSLKTEINALENRCKFYSKTITNQEQTINSLREETMNSMSAHSKSEVLLENAKRECALLRESEVRIRAERDILKQDKLGHAHLLSNLESIKASIDRSESEWKCRMEEKLDSAVKECSALRRRLQDEQDRYVEKVSLLEQNMEMARSRLEEEKKSSSELMNITNSLRLDLADKNKIIEELKEKLKMASSKLIEELELQTKSLQNKYQAALKDIEHQKELLNTARKETELMTNISENFEKQFVAEREAYIMYKREIETKILSMEAEISNLQGHNDVLQKRVNELSNVNQTSMIDLNKELIQEKLKNSAAADELTGLKLQLSASQKDLNAAIEAKLQAEKKYADEMLQHTNDIKELQKQVEDIFKLKNQVASLISERDTALMRAETVNTNWREEEARLKREMDAQSEKLNDAIQQNELLLNKIQELSLNIAVTRSQDFQENSSQATTDNPSEQAVDNWLQVIRFLRREKNVAVSNLNALSAENMRLKSELELIRRQLGETQVQLKAEQDKTDISNTTFSKHAELLKKVQTFSAVIDSNRVLREERDKFFTELNEIKEKLEHIEAQTVVPLRNENRRLVGQLETLQTENTGLQNRVNFLTKEMNRTNSEDVKDLKKSLNVEREAYNKTLDELRSVKQEKSKLEDQIKKLTVSVNKLTTVEKEKIDLQKELIENKTKMEKISQEFVELQKTFVEQEEMITKIKSSNLQLKSIARKYKSQCLELSEQVKELKEKMPEIPNPPAEVATQPVSEIPVAEQNRLRLEGRQQMETEINDRVKQLTDQLTANQGEIDKLLAENKALQETVAEKEVRATDILQQAKSKILNLHKAGKKHQLESKQYKERLQTVESAMREEAIARENVLKSSYENRISKVEKEKTESQAERDRLSREVEVLSQRINTLQRQLHSQPGVKSNVNSSQEKSNIEPPTANIKPMAGPSSSVTKSQQNQQSVAVTPWRSANETPLASIRPMSLQTRTAAVLPTSQTSCSASQSTVVVPPQQQLVDTSSSAASIVEAFSSSPSSSSHTDYNMPSTSSSVSHPPVRQVVVTPTQQASHSAESTQDMEAECGNQELTSQASLSSQQQSTQMSQNPASGLSTLSQIMTPPTVSQSQTPTVALVLPRIDLQNVSIPGSSHQSNAPEQSVVASSQSTTATPHVSASNQTDQKRSETYYQQDTEDSNLGQVSASSHHSQQQPVVASSIETAPEQSIIIASSQQSYEPSVASSNANSSNTVTTTQAGLKRTRETEGESSKSSSNNTETCSAQPQAKRTRRIEIIHDDLFRNEIDESGNADVLLRYSALDVEYQVPTSSQRDQEFDNLVIDYEGEDELEEDEQAMPDDGQIIDENDDVQEYVEDDEEVEENEEVYEMEEGYEREEQDTTMTSYNVIEGPDIDEEGVHVQDQDNEVEIMDEESNEVPNQSGRSDSTGGPPTNRRNCEQQSSEASSSGNSLRAQSASITSNQSIVPLQFNRRPSTIPPLNRQQNQPLLLSSQGFEDNTGDDSIVPSTPTLCVPRRTDGFGEAVSSPHVPSGGRFTFNESNPPPSRAAVIQMVSEGIDDTRIDLSQLDENSGTGRSVPSTPLQSSPQEIERIEVGQSIDDSQPLNEELSSNSNQVQQPPPEDILNENETFRGESADNELEVTNENENLIDETSDQGREESADGVTSDGQSNPAVAGPSQAPHEEEEGCEAEAATKGNDSKATPLPIPTTGNTARRSAGGRIGRTRGTRTTAVWTSNGIRTRNSADPTLEGGSRGRGSYRDRGRKPKQWYAYGKRYPM